MIDGEIKLRQLKNQDSDYSLLEKWYQEEEIYSQFEQRKLNNAEIKRKYYPRTKKSAKVPVFMIEYDSHPIGIIQYQKINEENQKLYGLKNNNSYEIDIFIGELNLHNKGIGSKAINIMTIYLFNTKKAELIAMCPVENNEKAIKCYEKSGFVISKKFNTENTIGKTETFLLMENKR
jgi:aminoglycoside 6'-N-acetyltransferase